MYLKYKHEGGVAGKLAFTRVRVQDHVLKKKHHDTDFFSCPHCYKGSGEVTEALLRAQERYNQGDGSLEEVVACQTTYSNLSI